MYGNNMIVRVYLAPKDKSGFEKMHEFLSFERRRWSKCRLYSLEELKVFENNRRSLTGYKNQQRLYGWLHDTDYFKKKEKSYVDTIGTIYESDFENKFDRKTVDFWGKTVRDNINDKNKESLHRNQRTPVSPMLDDHRNFEINSLYYRLYMYGEKFDTAVEKSVSHNNQVVSIRNSLVNYFKNEEKLPDDEATRKAERLAGIFKRNAVLDSKPIQNDYNFMVHYYNRFIDKKIREMAWTDLNMYLIRDFMNKYPDVSLFIMGPMNRVYKIQGMVGKQSDNIVIKTKRPINDKVKFDHIYSVDCDAFVYEKRKGFIPARKLNKYKSNLKNLMYGSSACEVESRYRSEYMYDFILEGVSEQGTYSWIDVFHNVFLSPDYSKTNMLKNKDIVC